MKRSREILILIIVNNYGMKSFIVVAKNKYIKIYQIKDRQNQEIQ